MLEGFFSRKLFKEIFLNPYIFRKQVKQGGLAQMVERSLCMREVPGLMPGPPYTYTNKITTQIQSFEQNDENNLQFRLSVYFMQRLSILLQCFIFIYLLVSLYCGKQIQPPRGRIEPRSHA